MKSLINRFTSIALLSAAFALPAFAEGLSPAELDLLVKEDIATAQVLTEICPALIGEHAKINLHVDQFTQTSLKSLSNPTTTLAQLKADAEYQAAYAEAKQTTTEYDKADQKQGCEEILGL
ncbi:MCR_0457 family protein [Acinetobacter sp. TGL-Y2]|uniref:MCR_0457 family protein n=1 Tax=Acinetobacter sp. TGL-Y2 TaxID=1407071 RepID=UPI0009D659A9|nr:hypothetical protein [Acinetobacter sp. TGL-Y2]